MSIFTVKIMRPGDFGLRTSATLEMPATWAEYQDAKQKARITDDKVIYSSKLLYCKYDWLHPHIPENADLPELNLLAARINKNLEGDIGVFEAMVKIEAGRGDGRQIPLQRLINMTFSIKDCHIVDNINSDTLLGKFLFENGFLDGGDAKAVQVRINSNRPVNSMLALLGKEHRESVGGALSPSGRYIEFDGTIDEKYTPGETPYFDCSDAPVVLKISKGYYSNPRCDNNPSATLELPLFSTKRLDDTLERLEAASLKECDYYCTGCLIPAAKTWLDNAQDFDQATAFAKTLCHMEQHGSVTVYKALLEAVGCNDLDTAQWFAKEIGAYQLTSECSGPEDYARDYLERLRAESSGIDLSEYVNLHDLGKKAMELENAAWTSYGALKREDGGQILAQANQPGMVMEMR